MKVCLHRILRYMLPAGIALTLAVPGMANTATDEEMIVTARKREESLQDVPISITAFSAKQLMDRGITSNYDVADFTVKFNTEQQVGRNLDRPIIRGQAAPSVDGEPNASLLNRPFPVPIDNKTGSCSNFCKNLEDSNSLPAHSTTMTS